jgi:hypothetical protein
MPPATLACEARSSACGARVYDTRCRAVGMAICLRSFVHHFRRGRYVIPLQLAKEYGLKVLLNSLSFAAVASQHILSVDCICRCTKVIRKSSRRL